MEKAFVLYPEVKVVVVAHLYGTPGKIDEIKEICDRHGAVIVEDAAESLGATYKGKQTGTFGAYNVISFNGNKIITHRFLRQYACRLHDVEAYKQSAEMVLPNPGKMHHGISTKSWDTTTG